MTQTAATPASVEASPTERLARFIAQRTTATLPAEVSERAATTLLDALALGLAARRDRTLLAYTDIVRAVADPRGACHLWGRSMPVSVLDGVTGNALAVHARFQDDCDMTSWSHPGSLIVPVAVGLGESAGVSIDAVLRALVCGYSTLNWLGANEEVGRALVTRGFRASPTLGSIAAAATAACLLGLDRTRARNAVAIAADITGGLLEPVRMGASDWRIENATAAYRGALAAMLAARGVDGPATALEGAKGFLSTFAGLSEVPRTWRSDPDERAILTVWSKPYPTLGDNMAVVVCALALRQQGLAPGDIVSITVHQNAHFASYPGTAYRGPFTRPAQAMASTAFATAAGLVHGPLRYGLYDTSLEDSRILGLIERIRVVPEPSYSYIDAMVEVERSDGSILRQAAADLPQTVFFRDRATAVTSFRSLLDEAELPQAFAARVPETVFAAADGTSQPIHDLIEAITLDQQPPGAAGLSGA